MEKLKRSKFTIDCISGYYSGYTYGDTWNGWACPYFSKKSAIAFLEEMKKNDCIKGYTFVKAVIPAFLITDTNEVGEIEIYEQEILNYLGKKIKVYGIGNHAWVWWDQKWDKIS
jgi:hypothetical protein